MRVRRAKGRVRIQSENRIPSRRHGCIAAQCELSIHVSHSAAIDILYAVTEAAAERIGSEDPDGERLSSGLRSACTLVRLTMSDDAGTWGAAAATP